MSRPIDYFCGIRSTKNTWWKVFIISLIIWLWPFQRLTTTQKPGQLKNCFSSGSKIFDMQILCNYSKEISNPCGLLKVDMQSNIYVLEIYKYYHIWHLFQSVYENFMNIISYLRDNYLIWMVHIYFKNMS